MPRRKGEQNSNWTGRYAKGDFDKDDADSHETFSMRSKHAQANKMRDTANMRAADTRLSDEPDALPSGEVIQVFSVYSEVLSEGKTYLAVGRRTQHRLKEN